MTTSSLTLPQRASLVPTREGGLDVQLVAIPFFLALLTAFLLWTVPTTLPRLLALDATLLAQAHVAATFWRVFTMPLTGRQRRFVSTDLLLASILVSVAIVSFWSVAVLATMYMFWQVYHYVRQSFGIERLLRRRNHQEPSRAMAVLLSTSALAAFMWAQAHLNGQFLGMPVYGLPPAICIIVVGMAAIALAASVWRFFQSELSRWSIAAHFAISHVVVFGVAYVGFERLEHAWLVSNVWHNAQYLLIVRNTITQPPGTGPDGTPARWLASRAGGFPFVAACIGTGLLAYYFLGNIMQAALTGSAAGVLAVYMGINFHHYVVDGLVWKRHSPTLAAIR